MRDAKRQALELRTIEVSARAALAKVDDPADVERIRSTATAMLARLEEKVVRDGGEPDFIAAIERARLSLQGGDRR